jgi:hypothetical protein
VRCLVSNRVCWIRLPFSFEQTKIECQFEFKETEVVFITNLQFQKTAGFQDILSLTKNSLLKKILNHETNDEIYSTTAVNQSILYQRALIPYKSLGELFRSSSEEESSFWIGSEISFSGVLLNWSIDSVETADENSFGLHQFKIYCCCDQSFFAVELSFQIFDINVPKIKWLQKNSKIQVNFALVTEVDKKKEIIRLQRLVHTRIHNFSFAEVSFSSKQKSFKKRKFTPFPEERCPAVTSETTLAYCNEEQSRIQCLQMNLKCYQSLGLYRKFFLFCDRTALHAKISGSMAFESGHTLGNYRILMIETCSPPVSSFHMRKGFVKISETSTIHCLVSPTVFKNISSENATSFVFILQTLSESITVNSLSVACAVMAVIPQ